MNYYADVTIQGINNRRYFWQSISANKITEETLEAFSKVLKLFFEIQSAHPEAYFFGGLDSLIGQLEVIELRNEEECEDFSVEEDSELSEDDYLKKLN